jgi:hypothetical protein
MLQNPRTGALKYFRWTINTCAINLKAVTVERRTHSRAHLHLPAFLVREGQEICLLTQTENVSKDGFFALVESAFTPGERLRFVLLLSNSSGGSQVSARVAVYGEVRVTRVVTVAGGDRYGIGCQLTKYRVLADAGTITTEALVSSLLGRVASDEFQQNTYDGCQGLARMVRRVLQTNM